jgi:predicted thioesterase
MKTVPVGITLRESFATSIEQTAAAAGNTGVEVISSVALILYIEEACYHLIAPYYETGEATVGTRFALDHVGPATAGRPVDVEVAVDAVEGRRVSFGVTVAQAGRAVMRGSHQRAFVDATRFGGGAAAERLSPARRVG